MSCKNIRVADILNETIVDGYGNRLAIYTQGCPHHCNGCHNEKTWDTCGGADVEVSEIISRIAANPLLDGVTLTGGEPFLQAESLIEVARFARERGLNVWAWSGWTYEQLLENPAPHASKLLNLCDVLIDGQFELDKRTLALEWRGSSNQRVIDLAKTRECGEVVLYEPPRYADGFDVPKWG